MDDGLVQFDVMSNAIVARCLNPCCSGQWSSTKGELNKNVADYVLILVVVEDGLVLHMKKINQIATIKS